MRKTKSDYARRRAEILKFAKNDTTKEAKADRRAYLLSLEEEVVQYVGNKLQQAARLFGYNPNFRVHLDEDKLWYEARNKSAERMLQRLDMIYMERELQRG